MSERLTPDQIMEAGLADWRRLPLRIHARFETGDFARGAAFVAAIGEAAEAVDHHPDVKLSYPRVDVSLWSHDALGVTQRDIDLAQEISGIAEAQGIESTPAALTEVEIAIDTADADSIGPFWGAVLTGKPDGYVSEWGAVVDGTGQVPQLWFQKTEPHEEPRQRFHLDVWVPYDVGKQRVAAALAAGGTLFSDSRAPRFWVLADADGNKACICTPLGRED